MGLKRPKKGKRYQKHLTDFSELEPVGVPAAALNKNFKDKRGVKLYCADVAEWNPDKDVQYDTIVSTLPMVIMDAQTVEKALKNYVRWLKPGGRLIYISLLTARTGCGLFRAFMSCLFRDKSYHRDYQAKMTMIDDTLQEHFDWNSNRLVGCSAPPIYVYSLTKKKRDDAKQAA